VFGRQSEKRERALSRCISLLESVSLKEVQDDEGTAVDARMRSSRYVFMFMRSEKRSIASWCQWLTLTSDGDGDGDCNNLVSEAFDAKATT